MTSKKLVGMALVLVLLATVAVVQKRGGISTSNHAAGQPATLFEGIDLNTVTAIDISTGSNAVALSKPDGKWVIATLYGYPADFSMLANTMRAAAQVEPGAPVRSGNVAESEYGLGTDAKKIVLKAGDKAVAAIEVGSKRQGSDSSAYSSEYFIRLKDAPSIYLVDYDFNSFPDTSEDWMDKQLLAVSAADLVEIKTDDVDLQLDGTAWKLADLDPATEDFQAAVAHRLHSGLQYLSCDSVVDPAKPDDELGFKTPAHYTARTRDGFTYAVSLGAESPKGRYVRIAVDYEKPEPPAAPADDAEPAKQDEYKQALDDYTATTGDNARKAVELNNRLSNWTYVISTYAANSLAVPRSELVKKKTPPTETDMVPTPPATPPPLQ